MFERLASSQRPPTPVPSQPEREHHHSINPIESGHAKPRDKGGRIMGANGKQRAGDGTALVTAVHRDRGRGVKTHGCTAEERPQARRTTS